MHVFVPRLSLLLWESACNLLQRSFGCRSFRSHQKAACFKIASLRRAANHPFQTTARLPRLSPKSWSEKSRMMKVEGCNVDTWTSYVFWLGLNGFYHIQVNESWLETPQSLLHTDVFKSSPTLPWYSRQKWKGQAPQDFQRNEKAAGLSQLSWHAWWSSNKGPHKTHAVRFQ